MSVQAQAVPLPRETQAQEAEPHLVLEYLGRTGWLLAIKAVLKVFDWFGILLLVPLAAVVPAVLLILSCNPLVLIATAHHLEWWLFFSLAGARLLVADPVNYLIGRYSSTFVRSHGDDEVKHFRRTFRRLRRLAEWLARANPHTILAVVFVLTLVPPPLLNPYYAAGAARMRFWKVMAVDVVASCLLLVGIFWLGTEFDLLGWLQSLALDVARSAN